MSEEKQIIVEQESSYRSIFKATSLFGGLQAYQILIGVIKTKLVSILLGPAGVGIDGLYKSAIDLIQQVAGMGLSSSAVRNVSEAYGTGKQEKVNRVVTAFRQLVWITGLLGMVAVILLSPVLSKISFGDDTHIYGFIIISITLLFTQLSSGQKVILQGTRKLKYLAKSTALGVTIGLFISIPLYYFFDIDGIVPVIVIVSLISLLISTYYSRKVPIEKVTMSSKDVIREGRTMLTLGVAMCLTHVFASLISYALRGFIRAQGGVEDVGIFTAGYQLMNQYTGLVFTAMITDFYPRLSAVNEDNSKCRELINKQAELGLLILAPMMCFCIVFISFVIILLFSEKFLPVNDYIIWCAVGIFFKMASFAIGYILLAKAESKLFLITETISSIVTFGLSILGFLFYGLAGLGFATAIGFLFYMVMIYIIARKRYDFEYSSSFIKLFAIQFVLILLCVVCVYSLSDFWKYILGSIIVIVSLALSLKELNKRMDISSLIKSKIKKDR